MEYELFPEIEPYNTGTLAVSDLHTLYYEEVGNPEGKPIIFLHGGPGGGLVPEYRRFFDPDFYRVILFDQRGSGKSTPHAELEDNTTWHIVEDIEKLRESLNIDKWLAFGGSWGSTLGLTYAIKHPCSVSGLILRGIFMAREFELNWLYKEGGVSNIYPDAWESFIEPIPEDERDDIPLAYYKRLTSDNDETRLEVAKAWSVWEGSISKLIPDEKLIEDFSEPHTAVSIAKIECHYFINDLFFETPEYLLNNIDSIKDIPIIIVQGRYDVVCPIRSAWELHKACPGSSLRVVKDAGHSSMEEGIINELIMATEEFKKL
jgi:proline iminopeptidase